MITNVLMALWGVFVVFIAAGLIYNMMVEKRKINSMSTYPFQDIKVSDIPYITMKVQGYDLNMIVDTGCGISIISQDALEYLDYEASSRNISLSALTSDSLQSSTVSIPFKIGSKQIKEDFVVYNQADIANFQKNYGITIHGLLGGEFFHKTNCKIDYEKNALIIP